VGPKAATSTPVGFDPLSEGFIADPAPVLQETLRFRGVQLMYQSAGREESHFSCSHELLGLRIPGGRDSLRYHQSLVAFILETLPAEWDAPAPED
jgi:hypothetical protein